MPTYDLPLPSDPSERDPRLGPDPRRLPRALVSGQAAPSPAGPWAPTTPVAPARRGALGLAPPPPPSGPPIPLSEDPYYATLGEELAANPGYGALKVLWGASPVPGAPDTPATRIGQAVSAGLPVLGGFSDFLKAVKGATSAEAMAPEAAQAARILSPEAAEAHLRVAPTERTPEGRLVISTRVPTSPKAPVATGGPLVTGIADAAQDPSLLRRLADAVRGTDEQPGYPLLRPRERRLSDRGVLQAFVDKAGENIDALISALPEWWQRRASQWYPGGQKIGDALATEVGAPRDAGVGVVATLSPGKEWNQNVDQAQRIGRLWRQFEGSDEVFSPEIFKHFAETKYNQTEAGLIEKAREARQTGQPFGAEEIAAHRAQAAQQVANVRAYVGRRWSDLPTRVQAHMLRAYSELTDPAQSYGIWSPEGTLVKPVALTAEGEPALQQWQTAENIDDALSILHDPQAARISQAMGAGHKVRSFFNNLSAVGDPRSVTVDTHNVGGAHFRPMGGTAREVRQVMGKTPGSNLTGITGLHPLYRDAVTEAARVRGLVPHEAQSLSWEAIKGLFSPAQRRNPAFKDAVSGLWQEYATGRISLDEAQSRVFDLAGGLAAPAWK
jgi:hypothetical protein